VSDEIARVYDLTLRLLLRLVFLFRLWNLPFKPMNAINAIRGDK